MATRVVPRRPCVSARGSLMTTQTLAGDYVAGLRVLDGLDRIQRAVAETAPAAWLNLDPAALGTTGALFVLGCVECYGSRCRQVPMCGLARPSRQWIGRSARRNLARMGEHAMRARTRCMAGHVDASCGDATGWYARRRSTHLLTGQVAGALTLRRPS